MSVLTRRDRLAVGSTQGGSVYLGEQRRWPEPAPGVFELFATHPGSIQRGAGDFYGHVMFALNVSDLDGTPKLYTGYGSINVNQAPIYIWPLSFNGVWDATYAHAFNAYSLQYYHHSEGKLWCAGGDGPADYCTGSPGGTWIDGWCSPTGFQHPFMITRHDGYTWVCGQTGGNHGGVWRGTHQTGNDGEFVLDDFPPGESLNRPTILFSYQGKLWYQAGYYNLNTAQLRYWDEPSHSFLNSGLKLHFYTHIFRPWKTVMLSAGSSAVERFNGTSVTKVYDPPPKYDQNFNLVTPSIVDIHVTPDDTVWILDSNGVVRSSTDLVTWEVRAHKADKDAWSLTVYEDFIYIGDKKDHIWRALVEL